MYDIGIIADFPCWLCRLDLQIAIYTSELPEESRPWEPTSVEKGGKRSSSSSKKPQEASRGKAAGKMKASSLTSSSTSKTTRRQNSRPSTATATHTGSSQRSKQKNGGRDGSISPRKVQVVQTSPSSGRGGSIVISNEKLRRQRVRKTSPGIRSHSAVFLQRRSPPQTTNDNRESVPGNNRDADATAVRTGVEGDGNAEDTVPARATSDRVEKGEISGAASNQDRAAGGDKDDDNIVVMMAEDNSKEDAVAAMSDSEGAVLRANSLKKLIFKFARNG